MIIMIIMIIIVVHIIRILLMMIIREYSSTRGTGSGFLRKSTGANGRKRFSTNTGSSFCSCRNLRIWKPPGVYGRIQSRNPVLQFPLKVSEKGEVLLRGVGTLRYLLILGENSACQVPICAVAA